MGRGTWSGIVPDGLWEIAEPLIPPSKVRPQGGGTQDTPDETLFAAIIYVLVSGCAWRALPPCFGVSKSTAHRRFMIWSRAGVRGRLHEAVLHQLDDAGLIDVSRVVLDSAHVRAKKGGEHTGPSPVDRGKPGSRMHILSDANGLPLLVGVSAANTHDSEGLKPRASAALPSVTASKTSSVIGIGNRPWRRGATRAPGTSPDAARSHSSPAITACNS